MTTAVATVVALMALSAVGFLPVVAAIGPRWFAVPLAPLTGAVFAGLAATASLSFGGALLDWFVGIAVVAALVVFAIWVLEPERGPWARPSTRGMPGRRRMRMAGIVGFVVVVISCVCNLRGLRSPTVGFDARALWVMRPGWFLQSHAQMLIDMKARGLVLTQSAYPPLVSASTAIAWRITGIHTARVGVTTVAALNICALAAAALALVDVGQRAAERMGKPTGESVSEQPVTEQPVTEQPLSASRPPWAPMITGIVAAALLVFVAAGVTEPFLTNGYADPIWSLAAVGAAAYGLQARSDRSTRAAAAVLILVTGLSKNEGLVTAIALVVLVAARSIGIAGLRAGWRRWVAPGVLAACELAVVAWWPILMHLIGARGASTSFTASNDAGSRTSAVVHGMSPYLHVLVVALPLSVVGGLALRSVRRRGGVGNDLWAWAALAVGLVAVGGALVTGSGEIVPWIRSTVHRITEYPVLQGWWIIAVWAVVASSGIGGLRPGATSDGASGSAAVGDDGANGTNGPSDTSGTPAVSSAVGVTT